MYLLFLAKMKSILLLLLCLLFAFPQAGVGQPGQPFVTDIPFERSLGEVRVIEMIQSSDRSMLMCTPRGVLAFDGSVWEMIPTPSPPLTMRASQDKRVFIGMTKGAAELMLSDSGTYHLRPLGDTLSAEPVNQILADEKSVFLLNDRNMIEVDLASGETVVKLDFGDRIFTGAFMQFKMPHLLFYQDGLFNVQEGQMVPIGKMSQIVDRQLAFDLQTERGSLLCFESGDLFMYDGIRVSALDGELSRYLRSNRPSAGLVLNDTLIAFATMSGGAVVADMRSYRIVHRLDYSTGLPDNEVTALGRDGTGGLWMAYGSGISRLDLLHPISRYHNYPGIKGIITGTAVKGNDLYVGTGNGVFVLRESRDRAELQRVMAERAAAEPIPEPAPEPSGSPVVEKVKAREEKRNVDPMAELAARYAADESAVKKELSRKELRELRKYIRDQNKKGNKTAEVEEEMPSAQDDVPVEETPVEQKKEPSEVKKVEEKRPSKPAKRQSSTVETSEKSSASYLFRPVKGLDAKCRQLTVIGNVLYAATASGIYLIEDEKATNLTPGLYVNSIGASKDGKRLLLATRNGAHQLAKQGGRWVLEKLHPDHRHNVYNVIEDAQGVLWAGADNAVIRYERSPEGHSAQEIALESSQLEQVLVADVNGTVHLLVPSGILQMQGGRPVKSDVQGLATKARLDFFITDRGSVWIHADGEWALLNGNGEKELMTYLPIFEDVRHLTTDDQGRLIVVDEGSEIYSIDPRHATSKDAEFSVFIRKALSEDRTPFSMGALTVKPGENSLTFHLSAPFFLKSMATEYQYRVEGLRHSWSRWSNNPVIEIPFIPAGDYVLHVRARNVLGEESEVRTLAFSVMKPIWQRWYAILLYIVLLAGIIILIIKAREKSLRATQRELEEKVQERTAELASEKEKTEKLLLNILPRETAEELRKSGKATARHYNQVSVLFTDFKGFTRFAESTRPEDLVQELDRCFIAFDDIIAKYHLEKIKTIGDAYMCAGGVPIRNTNNAVAVVLAALEIRDFMARLQEEKRQKNERFWEIRLGVNTGPLTAGVVGKMKFAYDIWGDTVNTASRMESCSEPGKVNISASTFELVKDYFDCTYRGKMDAKGKGEVDMYFVNGIRKEFSENGDGTTPNAKLISVVS